MMVILLVMNLWESFRRKGEEVQKLHVGQRVVVAFDIACGWCDYCKREEYSCCDTTNPSRLMEKLYGQKTAGFYGYSHLTGDDKKNYFLFLE